MEWQQIVEARRVSRVLLIIDLSNQIYKSAAAHPGLSSMGEFTGGLYGTLKALVKAVRETEATNVVVCEDRPPYLRKKQDPRYKSDRGEIDEVLMQHASVTKVQLKALFAELAIPMWGVEAFEFDDLCAYLVDLHRHRFDKIVAMSNDSDLYQLFRVPKFSVYRGKSGFYTRTDYDAEFNKLDPLEWKHVLSIAGSHNCVKGIVGIGFKTAAKILRDPVKLRVLRETHGSMIDDNLKLVELPHPEFKAAVVQRLPPLLVKRGYDERRIMKFLNRYEIVFQQDMRESLQRIMEA